MFLAGMKCHMKELNPSSPNFLSKEDDHLLALRVRGKGISGANFFVDSDTIIDKILICCWQDVCLYIQRAAVLQCL